MATPALMAQTVVSLRVMSMNIKEGGELANYDAEAYSTCIREYGPDVVVFQEMDNFTNRNGKKIYFRKWLSSSACLLISVRLLVMAGRFRECDPFKISLLQCQNNYFQVCGG